MSGEHKRKTKVGVVVSDAMEKSVTVEVVRTVLDPTFKKYLRRKNKFMAHDESDECRVGDKVLIRECRPISKRKRWKVERVMEKAEQVE